MTNDQYIQKAVVVGCGQMGPGIAYTLASVGCDVVIFGRTKSSVERGLLTFNQALSSLSEAGCLKIDHAQEISRKVSGTTLLESAVAEADLVIESISEDLQLKQELYARIEKLCGIHTILTSNTSGLPVGQLAQFLEYPERFAVTHFWNPPHLMPLVEIVKGSKTSSRTIDTLVDLLTRAGKAPVTVLKDTPGQLGNRLFHALIREAIYIVQEGIASVEDVDSAVKNGLGRRFPVYGPLEHQDVAGLDMVFSIQSYLCNALCNDTEPSEILRRKAQEGDLGVKSGKGFYDWSVLNSDAVIEKRDAFLLELLKAEQASGLKSFDR